MGSYGLTIGQMICFTIFDLKAIYNFVHIILMSSEDENPLPTLEGLDTRGPDYLKRVEEGLDLLQARLTEEEDRVRSFSLEQAQGAKRELEKLGIGSAEIEVLPEGVQLKMEGRASREDLRRLEEVVEGFVDRVEYNVISEGYRRRLEAIDFRLGEFRTAVAGLTKVKPLTDIRRDPDTVTLYVVKEGMVFEYRLNTKDQSFTAGASSLTEQVLTHPAFERQCRGSGEGVNGDLYRASNPSNKMPINSIALYGFRYAIAEVFKRYRAVPGRLRTAVEVFRDITDPTPASTKTLA